MKALVLSDSHGDLTYAAWVMDKLSDRISCILFLGDHAADGEWLSAFYGKKLYCVKGNCDANSACLETLIVELDGLKIYMTHGHRQLVKQNLNALCYEAEEKGCCCVLFGHTHVPFYLEQDGFIAMNPGSISLPRGKWRVPTYGILNFESKLSGSIVGVYGKEKMKVLPSI